MWEGMREKLEEKAQDRCGWGYKSENVKKRIDAKIRKKWTIEYGRGENTEKNRECKLSFGRGNSTDWTKESPW